MSPTKLRQAVLEILGVSYQDAQATMDKVANTVFWPSINEDILEHVNSRRMTTQPHPRKRAVATWLNVPFARLSDSELEQSVAKIKKP